MIFDYDRDALFAAIFSGAITPEKLPRGLYLKLCEVFTEAIDEGFATVQTGFAVDQQLVQALRLNVFNFSGAKTFQQVLEMSSELTKGGDILSFSEFRKSANEIFTTYNETWLETEYKTAIGQSQSIRKWDDIEKDSELFPYLQYDAVMDANTSTICRPLEGITLPVNHPFWNTYAPLNHFNCRCQLRKISKYDDVRQTRSTKLLRVEKEVGDEMQEMFKVNPGKEKKIFDKSHPYFSVPKKYEKFAAQNFGLPLPNQNQPS